MSRCVLVGQDSDGEMVDILDYDTRSEAENSVDSDDSISASDGEIGDDADPAGIIMKCFRSSVQVSVIIL